MASELEILVNMLYQRDQEEMDKMKEALILQKKIDSTQEQLIIVKDKIITTLSESIELEKKLLQYKSKSSN